MTLSKPFYINRLMLELDEKKAKNNQFSLRSFARDLEVNSGTLSRILKGERIPSMGLGRQIAINLNLDEKELDLFLNSLADAKWQQKPMRISQELKNFGSSHVEGELRDDFQIELEQYRLFSDWIHYSLMELTFVHDFKNDVSWIAKKLNRSVSDVEGAIKRLLDLNLLKEIDGRLVKTHERVTSKDKSKTTKFHKKLQKDLLKMAIRNIDHVDISKRIASSMTMAIDPKNIDKAREHFSHFLSQMCDLLEEGSQSEVYTMTMNLGPVTTPERGDV